jgi:DNA modification methylase
MMTTTPKPYTPLEYLNDDQLLPLFLTGNALEILQTVPNECIDCCITSPPYWSKRQYENGGIGLEKTFPEYLENLLAIITEVKRVLTKTGSFWLNLGDTYRQKNLQGIPWRVAINMMDTQHWILRNNVIWHKHKGGLDSSKDKLRNIHEHLFHFVKQAKYYYDDNAIRSRPREAKIQNGAVVSATGVSGIRYKRQIELSTALTTAEKARALQELEQVLEKIKRGDIADFRMIIRQQQRTTHSNALAVSGRAKQLVQQGYYFLCYHPNGTLPGDVWEILPEDTQKRADHYAVFPEDLCKVPILATCPPSGIVLDPFCGTGTAMWVAYQLQRKSIGIDISETYLQIAKDRYSHYEHQNSGTLQLFHANARGGLATPGQASRVWLPAQKMFEDPQK